MSSEKKERINTTNASLMIGTALILDVISAAPIVGQIVADVGSFVIFLIWFLILGLPLLSPKKITVYAVSFVVSIVPVLSALPEITLAIVAFILITRAEDKLGVQVLSRKGLTNPTAIAGELKPQFDRLHGESAIFRGAMKHGQKIRDAQTARRRPMNDMLPPNAAENFAS